VAKAIVQSLLNNIAGCGINLQSKVEQLRGSGMASAVNDLIEAKWKEWGKNCEVTERLNFWELERLILRTVIVQGECLIRIIKKSSGNSKVPLSLEFIAPQQLDEALIHSQFLTGGNRLFMGIEVDPWLKPVAYWITPANATEQYGTTALLSERVPASEIIHIYSMEEPHQLRGIPWLYASLTKLWNLTKFEQSLLTRARVAANISFFVRQPDLQEYGSEQLLPDGSNPMEENIPEGVLRKLLPGEDITIPPIPAPDANSIEFIRTQIKHAAVGTGTTYSSAAGDFSENNYSQSRMEQLKSLPEIRAAQKWFCEKFHSVVYGIWMDQAVLANDLPLPDYWLRYDRYHKPAWQFPGIRLQDPDKEADAYIKLIENGLVSRTWVVQETTGQDYEEVLKELKAEQELQKKYGVFPNVIPNQTQPSQAQNTIAEPAANQPQASPPSGAA
jgi:lambda family phage portal protein